MCVLFVSLSLLSLWNVYKHSTLLYYCIYLLWRDCVSLLYRNVSEAEDLFHGCSRSCYGSRAGTLPHHHLHHCPPYCPQGSFTHTYWQSVSVFFHIIHIFSSFSWNVISNTVYKAQIMLRELRWWKMDHRKAKAGAQNFSLLELRTRSCFNAVSG